MGVPVGITAAGIMSTAVGTATEVGMVVAGTAIILPGIPVATIGTATRIVEVGAGATPGTPAQRQTAEAGTVALAVQLADGMAAEAGVAGAPAEASFILAVAAADFIPVAEQAVSMAVVVAPVAVA